MMLFVLLFFPLVVMSTLVRSTYFAIQMMARECFTPLLTRPLHKVQGYPTKLLALLIILIIYEARPVYYSRYIPKSQRNLFAKAVQTTYRHGYNAVMECVDIYNWTQAKLQDEGVPTGVVVTMAAICMESTEQVATKERQVIFDTNSKEVGIDNRCTACISHVETDFVGPLKRSDKAIKGFGGATTRKLKIGMLRWMWADDDGKVHKFLIPNSYYVPHGKVRLLSPQHWAQAARDWKPRQGTGEQTDAENCTLYWSQKRYTKTIQLNRKGSNVMTMHLAPG